MDSGSPQKGVTAAFPPPPPFWKHFNQQNLDELARLKQDRDSPPESKQWSPTTFRDLELPPNLRYLVPPELPTKEYVLFGETQLLSPNPPSLEEQGIEQLYPSSLTESGSGSGSQTQPSNHAYYLTKIAKSVLLNFLELVGILSLCPEQFELKLDNLRNLFINAHHLLNLYRPHQARESLIRMMEEQLQKSREEIRDMDNMKEKVEEFLSNLKSEGQDARCRGGSARSEPGKTETGDVKKKREEDLEEFQDMWKAIDEINDG